MLTSVFKSSARVMRRSRRFRRTPPPPPTRRPRLIAVSQNSSRVCRLFDYPTHLSTRPPSFSDSIPSRWSNSNIVGGDRPSISTERRRRVTSSKDFRTAGTDRRNILYRRRRDNRGTTAHALPTPSSDETHRQAHMGSTGEGAAGTSRIEPSRAGASFARRPAGPTSVNQLLTRSVYSDAGASGRPPGSSAGCSPTGDLTFVSDVNRGHFASPINASPVITTHGAGFIRSPVEWRRSRIHIHATLLRRQQQDNHT